MTDGFPLLLGMFALSFFRGCSRLLPCFAEDLGDLDRVKRIVKLVGFVNCTDGFMGQPKVVNGASDLFAEVRHTVSHRFTSHLIAPCRSATIGVAVTWKGKTVEKSDGYIIGHTKYDTSSPGWWCKRRVGTASDGDVQHARSILMACLYCPTLFPHSYHTGISYLEV